MKLQSMLGNEQPKSSHLTIIILLSTLAHIIQRVKCNHSSIQNSNIMHPNKENPIDYLKKKKNLQRKSNTSSQPSGEGTSCRLGALTFERIQRRLKFERERERGQDDRGRGGWSGVDCQSGISLGSATAASFCGGVRVGWAPPSCIL